MTRVYYRVLCLKRTVRRQPKMQFDKLLEFEIRLRFRYQGILGIRFVSFVQIRLLLMVVHRYNQAWYTKSSFARIVSELFESNFCIHKINSKKKVNSYNEIVKI